MEIQLLVLLLATLGAWYYSSLPTTHSPHQEDRRRKNYFIFLCMTSWPELWDNFRNVYVLGEGKDAGYPLIEKVFQLISGDYRVFLFFIAIIFFTALGYFIYTQTRYIRDVFLAVVIYEVLFYSFFSITGLRQTLATVFTFYGLHFIRQRRLWQYTLLILCAAFIHKSVLLFYPFYFIARLKRPKQLLAASFISCS